MRASAQVIEMSVANNSQSQDSNNPDDLFDQGMFKPFSYCHLLFRTVYPLFSLSVSNVTSFHNFFKSKRGLGQRFLLHYFFRFLKQ